MNRQYFFMAGLPRSGSTLLSAIFNQNPKIYSGEHTNFPEMMMAVYQQTLRSESFNAGYNSQGYVNLLGQMLNNFYINTKKPIVIDKNRTWGTPEHIELLDLLSKNVKIICPVRPILDILSSFVKLAEQNPNNFIDKKLDHYYQKEFRSINDARCDLLMSDGENLAQNIYSLATALNPRHAHKFHFVKYDDLINEPKKTMNEIYDFLEIKPFQHNFNNLYWTTMPNEFAVFGIKDMHSVRPIIGKQEAGKPKLSEYVKDKYGKTLDFLLPVVNL